MDFKTMRAFPFLLLCASKIFLLGLVGAADGLKIDLIGIDIGTRYSCMGTGVGDDNDIVIIENDQGNRITPSLVSFTDTEILIGEAAKNQTSLNPEGTIFNFKRLIGRNFDDSEVQREIKFLPYKIINKDGKPYIEVKVNGDTKVFSPEDITAMMLGKMKDMAELYLGKEITSAIVTIPAYFNDAQRKATEYAAAKAGLNKTFLLHEPEAIASAYGYGHPYKTNKANVLIFDFGDSTFDVTIFALYRGNFEVLTATSTRYSDAINLLEPLTNLELDLHLFNKTVKKALEDAGLKETDIDEIIIEGGSSRRLFPNVQQLLKNLFNGKEPIMSRFDNPHEVVAFGAAVVAADINNPYVGLLPPPNYNPLSLGIEIDGGVMMKMTPAKTIFPSNRSQTFTTCTDQQTIVSIKVYEGEGKLTKDCHELSRFYLTIPPAPRGLPQIEVTFLLDGYLRVIATDKAANKSESKNFYLGVSEQELVEGLEDFDYEAFKRNTEYLKKLKEKTDSPGTSLKTSLQHEEHQ